MACVPSRTPARLCAADGVDWKASAAASVQRISVLTWGRIAFRCSFVRLKRDGKFADEPENTTEKQPLASRKDVRSRLCRPIVRWLPPTPFTHLNPHDECFRQRPEDLYELCAPLRGEVRARPHGGVARAHAARAAQARAFNLERRASDGRVARSCDRADKLLRHVAFDRPRVAVARGRARRSYNARAATPRAARARHTRAARARRRTRLTRAHGSLRHGNSAPTPQTRARSRAGREPRSGAT